MKTIKRIAFFLIILLLVSLAAVPAAGASLYTIQRGETLWQIARSYQTTVEALAAVNNVRNVNWILAGSTLRIPAAEPLSNYTVRPGDTLWLIAQRYKTTVADLAKTNGIQNPHYIEAGRVIRIPGEAAGAASRSSASFSAAELDLMARLVHAEAGGEPYVGQVAVAASVLNRMRSSRYPKTVTGVINQVVNGYYQYSPVLDGRIRLPANDSARRAVREAISGTDPSLGALGFYNPRKTSNQWVRRQPVTNVIGNHVFFR